MPNEYKNKIETIVPHDLINKTYYIENDCEDVWDWSEKVYKFVEEL